MSGGYFQYKQHHLEDIAREIEEVVRENDREDVNKYGDTIGRGYSPGVIGKFKEGVVLLRRAAVYAQRIDWLLSSDDGPETFLGRLEEELKELEETK